MGAGTGKLVVGTDSDGFSATNFIFPLFRSVNLLVIRRSCGELFPFPHTKLRQTSPALASLSLPRSLRSGPSTAPHTLWLTPLYPAELLIPRLLAPKLL